MTTIQADIAKLPSIPAYQAQATEYLAQEGLGQQEQLLIVIPEVMAPIMTIETETSIERWSFLASN